MTTFREGDKMEGFVIFVGFILGGVCATVISQMLTDVKSVSQELGIAAWGFAGGIVGVILADLLLQTL